MRLKIDKLFWIPPVCGIINGGLLFSITYDIGICIICAVVSYVGTTIILCLYG